MERLDAVILDPDVGTRMRLKQVTSSVGSFGRTMLAVTPNEAISYFNLAGRIDICFVSSSVNQQDIDEVMTAGRASSSAQDSAFISVLKGHIQEKETLAQSVVGGFDGLLFEPYSVDQLVTISRLAARVRKERSDAREIMGIKMLVAGYIELIDQIATISSRHVDCGMLKKKLSDNCQVLKRLSPERLEQYHMLVTEALIAAPIPKKLFNQSLYGGASKRVQKKQIVNLQEKVAKLS